MQQANEKSAEPSMEDILASIRKIIAEEPASSAPPAPRPPVPGLTSVPPPVAAAPRPMPAAPQPRPAAPPPVARQPQAPVAPAQPVSAPQPQAAPTRLSDIMRELAPTAVPLSAPTIVSFHDDLDDLVEGDGVQSAAPALAPVERPAERPAPRLELRPEPISGMAFPTIERNLPPVSNAPAAPAPAVEAKAADLGAFVPMNRDSFSTMQRAEPAAELKVAEFNRVERGTPVPTEPVPLPLALPVMPQLAKEEAVATVAPEPELADAPSATDDAVAAAQSALGALALGLAAPSNSMIVAPPAQAEPEPAAMPVQSTPPARRQTLDDAVIDMLRPMVREWLDAHLPEMVEQALRLEMADSLKRQN